MKFFSLCRISPNHSNCSTILRKKFSNAASSRTSIQREYISFSGVDIWSFCITSLIKISFSFREWKMEICIKFIILRIVYAFFFFTNAFRIIFLIYLFYYYGIVFFVNNEFFYRKGNTKIIFHILYNKFYLFFLLWKVFSRFFDRVNDVKIKNILICVFPSFSYTESV